MNSRNQRNFCLMVTGFDEDIERRTLKTEFSKFGNIEKLYLNSSCTFAKIFYRDKVCCDRAIQELNGTALNWKVEYCLDNYTGADKKFPKPLESSSDANKMAAYGNYYDDDEDFSENYDYCNIHGQPLVVLQADSGDLYVKYNDVRKSGFALFRKDNFDPVLNNKRQIGKEFELHLLSEAKNYILKNRVADIDEDQILKTIQRCKSKLLGGDSENRGNVGAGRSVAPLPNTHNFKITSEVEQTLSDARFPMVPQAPNQRPPKTLSSNFMPTNCQRVNKFKTRGPGQRAPRMTQNTMRKDEKEHKADIGLDNRERTSGFVNGFDNPIQKREHKDSLNNSTDSQGSYKKTTSPNQTTNNEHRRVPYIKDDIGNLTFEIEQTYQVQVVYNEKENCCWVQDKNEGVLEDMFLKINEMEADLETITPVYGQLVIALFKEAWNRGRVTKLNPLMVRFIDFGNMSEVGAVKPLPEVFRKIPALAARITYYTTPELSDSDELHIKIKKQFDDGTYFVEIINTGLQPKGNEIKDAKPSEIKKADPSKENCYFEIPKPISELKNGDKIMMIDADNNKFLVRTRECALKSKELTEYIKNLDKSALTLTNVSVGQMVLCSKDGLVGLYRAIVSKKESGSVVTVKYIDFPGEDDLSVKSLRNVDNFLANEPSTIILSPEYKALSDMKENVAEYIMNLCQNKQKFIAVLSGNDFDLQFDDGTLLSDKIEELKKAKQKAEQAAEVKPSDSSETNQKLEFKQSTLKETDQIMKKSETQSPTPPETKVLYEEMDWIKINPGTYEFMCYFIQDLNDITMISTTEDVIMYLEQITDLEVADSAPYKPMEFEMCLVSFKGPEEENDSWYRAVSLERDGDGYVVTFVDFGNKEVVKPEDIRKFPSHLKEIPILGVNCRCIGLPNTPEINEHLKKLIPEGEQVEVIVKGLSDLTYEIEIPDVYKQLKTKGLY